MAALLICTPPSAKAESLFTLGASQTYSPVPKSLYGGVQARTVGDLISIILDETINVSNNVTKQAIKDACTAYKNFFKGLQRYPRFKSKKKSMPKFYQDNIKIQFSETHVKLEGFSSSKKANKQKLNWVRLAEHERIPADVKYMNPRISFDGFVED